MIARSLEDIFHQVNNSHGDIECELSISFIEIYNEKVFDLLGPNQGEASYTKGLI